MGRGFAHPLGIYKFAKPLNGLFRLESRHSEPNLELVHSESNRSNIENTIDALQVQIDLDSFDNRNDRATHAISCPQIKCSHKVKKIGSETVTIGSQPILVKMPSNPKY